MSSYVTIAAPVLCSPLSDKWNSLKFHQNKKEVAPSAASLIWAERFFSLTHRHRLRGTRHFAAVIPSHTPCNSYGTHIVYRCANRGCKFPLPWSILYRTCLHIYCFGAVNCLSMLGNRFPLDPCRFRKSNGTNGSDRCRRIQLKDIFWREEREKTFKAMGSRGINSSTCGTVIKHSWRLRQKAKVLLYFLPALLVALFISTTFRRVRGLERELFSTHKRQIRIGLVSIFDNKCGSHTNVVFFRHNFYKRIMN